MATEDANKPPRPEEGGSSARPIKDANELPRPEEDSASSTATEAANELPSAEEAGTLIHKIGVWLRDMIGDILQPIGVWLDMIGIWLRDNVGDNIEAKLRPIRKRLDMLPPPGHQEPSDEELLNSLGLEKKFERDLTVFESW
jgi:hypothetical protein